VENNRVTTATLKKRNGRHDWTRTSDLYRVKAHLFNPLNNLNHRWGPPNPSQTRVRRSFNGLKNELEDALVGSRVIGSRELFSALLVTRALSFSKALFVFRAYFY
jgi:hypothetical protein